MPKTIVLLPALVLFTSNSSKSEARFVEFDNFFKRDLFFTFLDNTLTQFQKNYANTSETGPVKDTVSKAQQNI